MSDAADPGTGEDTARSVLTDVHEGRVSGIEILESRPKNITLHSIEDHELEMLMNISSTVALSICTLAIGAFIGLLPSSFQVLGQVGHQLTVSYYEVALLVLDAICLATGAATGVFAFRGQRQASRTLTAIRARPRSPIIGRM